MPRKKRAKNLTILNCWKKKNWSKKSRNTSKKIFSAKKNQKKILGFRPGAFGATGSSLDKFCSVAGASRKPSGGFFSSSKSLVLEPARKTPALGAFFFRFLASTGPGASGGDLFSAFRRDLQFWAKKWPFWAFFFADILYDAPSFTKNFLACL